jgi:hypothetical protein
VTGGAQKMATKSKKKKKPRAAHEELHRGFSNFKPAA